MASFKHVTKHWKLLNVLKTSTGATCASNCHQKRWKSGSIRLSYVHGPGPVPLIGSTIGQFVNSAAERFPDDEAFVDCLSQTRKTFQQYTRDINNLAAGLLTLKLKPGDRIGIWSPNRYEWLLSKFAAHKLGLIVVTINPAYKRAEFEYALELMELKALIAPKSFLIQDYYKMVAEVVPELESTKPGDKIRSKKHPHFEVFISMSNDAQLNGTFKFSDIAQAGSSAEHERLEDLENEIQISDVACVMFTSGTTGKPKGAMLTHHNIVNGSYLTGSKRVAQESRRLCTLVPFFHTFGYIAISLMGMLCGQCVVLPAPMFKAEAVLQAIHKEKCTSIYGTPTMFIDLLNSPLVSKTDFSSLILGGVSGAPCPAPLMRRFTDVTKLTNFNSGYGMTELSGGVFLTQPEDSFETKVNTVGQIYDFMEAKIINPESGEIVPIGENGEICIRGYKVMKGYWKNEQATAETIKKGWLHTGDIGSLTEEGNLKVIDRLKDLIIRGGENIYPKEIEDFFMAHPKIAEAQVIGVPDERMGEEVCIWIRLRPDQTMTESEVKEYCKGKISHFKIPRYVRFVKDLPKTVSGKVQKFVIRQEMKTILESRPNTQTSK